MWQNLFHIKFNKRGDNMRQGIVFKIKGFQGKSLKSLEMGIHKGKYDYMLLPLSGSDQRCQFYIEKSKRQYCLKKAEYRLLLRQDFRKAQFWYEAYLCSEHKNFFKDTK
jgi:hypothetical protein